jgi:uncharacterized protein (DUF2141 family)
MKKLVLFFFIFITIIKNIYADVNIIVEIHNITENIGKIYVGIYFSEKEYKGKRQNRIIEIEPTGRTISTEIILPEGEYVLDVYQDINNNGICDLGIFNIPNEPIGITNYNGGIPGNFNKHKIQVNNKAEKVIINMYRF